MSIFGKLSFKDQAFKLRENSILDATTGILATKGFDLMTMDDVANLIGISKPSLYKHFKSKEELVGTTMIRLLDDASFQLGQFDQLVVKLSAKDKLSALLAWALQVRLDGGLPFLPSTSTQVRDMLMRNLKYVGKVLKLNAQLEKLVQQAQKSGDLNPELPTDVILYSYYARTCDPAVDYLQRFSKMAKDDIVKHMVRVCFDGLGANKPV